LLDETAWDHHENRCNWLDTVDCSRAEKTTEKIPSEDDEEGEEQDENTNDNETEDDTSVVVVRKSKKKNTSNKRMLDNNEEDNDQTTTSRKKSDTESVISESSIPSIIPPTRGKDSSSDGNPAIECQPTGIYTVADPME